MKLDPSPYVDTAITMATNSMLGKGNCFPEVVAGERGFMPLSITLSESYLKTHWQAVLDGAEKSGKTANRADWRIAREVYIAETDKGAKDKAINGMLGRVYREYLLPLFKSFGMIGLYKHHPEVPDSDVTIDYLAEYCWLVGLPKTIVDKLGAMPSRNRRFWLSVGADLRSTGE